MLTVSKARKRVCIGFPLTLSAPVSCSSEDPSRGLSAGNWEQMNGSFFAAGNIGFSSAKVRVLK